MDPLTEQNREPRNKLLYVCPNDFQQECQDYTVGKRQSVQQMAWGKLYVYVQNNEVVPLFYTICKN